MERQSLSIRKFAEVCAVSHTEVQRRMKELNIEGLPQGKGLPTLLNPAEQDQIAQALFIPATAAPPAQKVDVIGGGIGIYSPPPLALRGSNGELSRNIQTMHMTMALSGFKQNQAGFRDALLGMAAESGRQLGHDMAVAEMSNALATHAAMQTQSGKQLGVVEEAPNTDSNG